MGKAEDESGCNEVSSRLITETGSKLKIFGQADLKTIQQMKNCLAAEEESIGTLCADNHYGYSQPVGAAIAYRDHISVSGVGYDIGCVDADSEFLTPTGWKPISEYSEGDEVLQYNLESGKGSFVAPQAYIVKKCKEFYQLKSKYGIDQLLSAEHRILAWVPAKGKEMVTPKVTLAEDFVNKHNSLKQGMRSGFETAVQLETDKELKMSDIEIQIQMMVNADAYLDERTTNIKAVVSLKKDRKITRARNLLKDSGINFTETYSKTTGYTTFRFTPPILSKEYKLFWGASREQLEIITEECLHWDESLSPKVFYTRNLADAEFIQYAFSMTGRRAVLRSDVNASDGKLDYRVFAHDKTKISLRAAPQAESISKVPSLDGKSYCFTVPTGFWFMRRNGKTVVTGNCGNLAVKTNLTVDQIDIADVMDQISEKISFGLGRNDGFSVDHPIIDRIRTADFAPQRQLADMAANQLGTVGTGNHYVDLFKDENGIIWIGVHFGSRGFGHKTANGFLSIAQGGKFEDQAKDGEMEAPPTLFELDSESGQAYLSAMTLAGEYAFAGREVVVDRVLDILGAKQLEAVHNYHNYSWEEEIGGEKFHVVRKGCTPAYPGQKGFVGSTMGEASVILQGSGDNSAGLFSTVHGAGRAMSRNEAAGKRRHRFSCTNCGWFQGPGVHPPKDKLCPKCNKKTKRRPVQMSKGKIDFDSAKEELALKGIELRGGDADEAPGAYKRLDQVLAAHGDTIQVLHRLEPIGVAMAPPDTFDPFKD